MGPKIFWMRLKSICEELSDQAVDLTLTTQLNPDIRGAVVRTGPGHIDIVMNPADSKDADSVILTLAHELAHVTNGSPEHDEAFCEERDRLQRVIGELYAQPVAEKQGPLEEDCMLYFAYGSNLDWEQMRKRCPSAQFVCIAMLPEHILDFPRYSSKRRCGVADVTACKGHTVWGVVYEIEEQDIAKLNQCEGYDPDRDREENAYNQETMIVFPGGDRIEKLEVTLYKAVRVQSEKPSKEYLGLIISGAKYWRLPKEYIRELDSIQTA